MTTSPTQPDSFNTKATLMALSVNVALGMTFWYERPVTSLRFVECPACRGEAAKWLTCDVCGGSRKVVVL